MTILVPIVLAFAMLIQGVAFRKANGPTYDESFHLSAGLSVYLKGDFGRFAPELAGPLSSLTTYWAAAIDERAPVRYGKLARSPSGRPLWEKGHEEDWPLINRARLAALVLLGLPLMALVYTWLLRTVGFGGAVLGAGMLAFSPTVTAQASLATSDMCFVLASLLSLAFLAHYGAQPKTWRLAAIALAVGAALSAKLSALFLLPIVLLVVCIAAAKGRRLANSRSWLWIAARRALGVFGGAFLVWWAFHGFAWSPPDVQLAADLSGSRWLGRLQAILAAEWRPAPVASLQYLARGMATIEPGFLAGHRSATGWWYYFPVAFLLKSSPAELAFTALAIFASAFALYARLPGKPDWLGSPSLWIAALGVFGILALTSPLNIGQRHILLVYVLLFMLGSHALVLLLHHRQRVLWIVAVVVLGSQLTTSVYAAPRAISYFNSIAGGPDGGHRYLVDSNIDWGQDLPHLAPVLRHLGCGVTLLGYFGTATPTAHSLRVVSGGPLDCVAVSVTLLHGVYLDGDPYQPMRNVEPTGRAGHSIFVYDVRKEGISDAWRAAASAHGADRNAWTSVVHPTAR